MATFSEIVTQIEQKKFAPIYLLDGDEPFYIDRLMQQFEHKVLNPEERDFNLITLYGKETNAHEVIQAARRFPMFAEHTVVLLKEANQMKSIQELVAYVDQPLSSTILVLEHRFSKIDGRGGKLLKAIAGKGVHFNSMKIRESDVPRWTIDFGKSMKIKIGDREAEMLTVFLGNDLQKIANELEKVKINEPNLEQLTVAHIEKYMGVNREYNVFEFPATLFLGDR